MEKLYGMGVSKCKIRVFKFVWRLGIAVLIAWLSVLAVVSHFYQDVTTCFNQGAEGDTVLTITIHHDAVELAKIVSLKDIDKFHAEVRKWSCGFAYNYYITPDRIYKVRFDKNKGAHVLNNNSGNIGICLHGNFDVERPTLKQQILLICLVNYLAWKYDLTKDKIKIHRDWDGQGGTSCCGANFDKEKFLTYIYTK